MRLFIIIMVILFNYGCAGDNNIEVLDSGQGDAAGQNQNQNQNQDQAQSNDYPLHTNVSVTLFWIGEAGSSANSYIPNAQSAWDDKWAEHYGGVDDPYNRSGYYPADFVPDENPFYFALPYNDFDGNGSRKTAAFNTVYWVSEKSWGSRESMCKNQWIQIIKGNKVAYAQWEDVGPYNEDDSPYVFGDSVPQNSINNYAGLDVSPAVRDYLGLSDVDKVDWKFIDADKVPDGPWKDIVTHSEITWN